MGKISGNPKEIKNINRSLIISSIKERGSATRPQIAEDSGVTQTTVRSILVELLQEEEILIDGIDKSTGGRRAERYIINKNKKLSLIMYFNKEGLVYNILNLLGERLLLGIKHNQKQISEEILKEIIDEVLEQYEKIDGIILSVPGVVDEEGYYSGYEINDWVKYPVIKYIRENYNIPVVIENDLNIISLGYSIEKSIEDVVSISLTSLGAGAGIIVNNNIIDGSTNFAGEIGCLPYKNSIVNDVILNDFSKEECIDITIYLISTVNCILNPKVIVISGELFDIKYKEEILEKLEKLSKYNTLCKIKFEEDEEKYIIAGLKKLSSKLVEDIVKIVRE